MARACMRLALGGRAHVWALHVKTHMLAGNARVVDAVAVRVVAAVAPNHEEFVAHER